MSGGGDRRRMSIDGDSPKPLPNNSRTLVISDPLALSHAGQSSSFPREDMANDMYQQAESIVNHSQKLQDELQELGEKLKHHEDNVKYLKAQTNKLDGSILDLQVSKGKYHTSVSKGENEDSSPSEDEEEIIQRILKYEKSAAAIFYCIKSKLEGHTANHPLMKDVLGVVATLGKVDDSNLSRLLSEYLGLDTMLAVVCRTYEGVKSLEAYNKDGSIKEGLGIHALAASMGRPSVDCFLVICVENLRPYSGEIILDDPQRRLDLLKPRLINGETPTGFLGFAVNMITIEGANLYCVSKTGHSLRETLFYHLFSHLQVYKSREDMLKARPFIAHGAISLDGGIIRCPGVLTLGHHRGDIDVKFPCDSKRLNYPVNYFDLENQLKSVKWKKDRVQEDKQREQELLEHARFRYEAKKQEFVQFLAESSSYATQMGRASTPR